MITLESITQKLGYNPLRHQYCTNDIGEDDNWEGTKSLRKNRFYKRSRASGLF